MLLIYAVMSLAAALFIDWLRKLYSGPHVPQSLPLPVLGHLLGFLDTPRLPWLLEQEASRHRGNVCKINLLGNVIVLVRGADNNRQILLADRERDDLSRGVVESVGSGFFREQMGPRHTSLRRIFDPFLTRSQYQDAIQSVLGSHLRLKAQLREVARAGTTIDLEVMFQQRMFDAMCELVFGAQIDSTVDSRYYLAWEKMLGWITWLFAVQNIPYWRMLGDTSYRKQFLVAEDTVRELARSSLRRLRGLSDEEKANSLLGTYILSGDTSLTEEDQVDHCLNFLWGANDSTRMTLVMALVESVRHPDVAEAVRAEMRQLLRADQEYPSADQIDRAQAPQINAYVSELLRLYPAFTFLLSKLVQDVTLEGSIVLPAGTTVATMLASDQADPAEWGPDAKQFRPSRWLDRWASGTITDPRSFQVFGNGRRSCPGRKLAMMDVRLFIGGLLKDFEFHLQDSNVQIYLDVSLKTRGVPCTVTLAQSTRPSD